MSRVTTPVRQGIIVAMVALILSATRVAAQVPDGAAIFERSCRSCHNGAPANRAPSADVLKLRSPEGILSALTAGSMRPQGGRLTGAERRAVAEFLTGKTLGGDLTGASLGRCATVPAMIVPPGSPAWTGWSTSSLNGRYQTAQQAGLTEQTVPRLTLKWALGFPDATSAWSQPTIVGGRLFVGSQNGTVYALDAKSGCIFWTFSARTGVRTAPVIGERSGGGYALYFGDTGANLYAVNAATGKELWRQQLDEHPFARITGSPTLDGSRLYVPISSLEETAASQAGYACCSFRGSVAAIDIDDGHTIWKTYMVEPAQELGKTPQGVPLLGPSGVGVWTSPTVDRKRGLVYITTGNTYSGKTAAPTTDAILALDPRTGAIKWSKQLTTDDIFGCRAGAANCLEKAGPDFDFGTPAILATTKTGRDLIILGQKSGMAYAVDPDKQGDIVWQYRAGQGSIWGGIQWGVAVDDDRVYLPVSDIRTPTPGGLHAVSLTTGERIWVQPPPPLKCKPTGATCNAALISPPTLIPGVLFSGSNDGALRAHSTRDGSILWEFDTNREFLTLNGVRATGGAIQAAGPAVAGGMVYINAGYGDHLGRPGNVLLAFEVQ
jgi:polyvinyl alcohol dehydrogenase (cytochrome)